MTLPIFFLLKLLKSEVLSVRFQNRSKKLTSISIIRNLTNGSFGHVKVFFDKLSTVVLATPNCFIQNGNCSNRIMSFWKNCIVGKKNSKDTWFGLSTVLQKFSSQKPKTSFSRSALMERIFFSKTLNLGKFYCGQQEFSSAVHAKKSRQKSLFSCA